MATIAKANQSNTVISGDVNKFVKQFNQLSRKTAESVIGMGTVVYEAKTNLGKDMFTVFCAEIRYDAKSSAIRKLIQIGAVADVLKKHADKMPNTWTTIYHLSQLGNDVLEQMIESGKIYSAMSGEAAKQLVDTQRGVNDSNKPSSKLNNKLTDETAANDDGYVLTIRFDVIPSREKALMLETMIAGAANLVECSVSRSTTLDKFLNDDVVALAA